MKTAFRRASLAFVCLLAPGVAFWVYLREMTFLWWIVPGAAALSFILFGVWYLLFGMAPPQRRFRRVLFAATGTLILGGGLSRAIRYEGSLSGSSFPAFSWAWETHEVPPSPNLPAAPLETNQIGLPPGAVTDLPDFLGPGRDGMWERPSFATDWVAHPPVLLWRKPVGKGWSSFTVTNGHALTQQQLGDAEHVTSFDLATGREQWSHADPQTRLLLERAENGGAAMGGELVQLSHTG